MSAIGRKQTLSMLIGRSNLDSAFSLLENLALNYI